MESVILKLSSIVCRIQPTYIYIYIAKGHHLLPYLFNTFPTSIRHNTQHSSKIAIMLTLTARPHTQPLCNICALHYQRIAKKTLKSYCLHTHIAIYAEDPLRSIDWTLHLTNVLNQHKCSITRRVLRFIDFHTPHAFSTPQFWISSMCFKLYTKKCTCGSRRTNRKMHVHQQFKHTSCFLFTYRFGYMMMVNVRVDL